MLHVTKGIKYKKPPNNPESLHKAKLELGALLKVHLHKMCQPDKQQLSKICQVSPINSQLITSPSFNCQCLIPKLETFKERWGWRDSRRHRKRAAIFMFSHTYIYMLLLCLASTSKMAHKKRCLFICPEFLSVRYPAENRRTSANEEATFPNGQVDVATRINTVLCWVFTQHIEETATFPHFPDLKKWFELRSSYQNVLLVLTK